MEKTYLEQCKENFIEELQFQKENGEYNMDALFDCCGDLDPFEVLGDMVF